MKITCNSEAEARKVAYEVTRNKEVIGVSPEYFERLGLSYTLYDSSSEFKEMNPKISKNCVILKVDKMLDKSMTLVDFLAKNPELRKVDDVAMYFRREFIDEAIKKGAVNIQKGCIVV